MSEALVVRLRPHGRRLVLPCILAVVVATGLGFSIGGFDTVLWTVLVVTALVLVGIVGVVLPVLVWLRTTYVITTRRIVVTRGVVTRHEQEMDLADLVDVSTRRGPAQSVAGSATLDLTAVTGRRLQLVDVPDARLVADALRELATAGQARARA